MLDKSIWLLLIVLTLSACATSGPQSGSQSGDERIDAPIQRVPVRDVNPEASDSDNPKHQAQSRAATAAGTLLAAADNAMREAQPGDAVVLLERAIRLDPRNAELWIELAGAHMAQDNLTVATQHVRKAIALAESDMPLLRRAWLRLADIKAAQGDINEAKSIRRRYSRVRG